MILNRTINIYKQNALDLIDWVSKMIQELENKNAKPDGVYLAGGSLLREDSPDRDIFLVYKKFESIPDNLPGCFMGLNSALEFDIVEDCESFDTILNGKDIQTFRLSNSLTNVKIEIIPVCLELGNLKSWFHFMNKTFPLSIQKVYYDFKNKCFSQDIVEINPIYVSSGVPKNPKFSLMKYVNYYPDSEFIFSAKALEEVLNNNEIFDKKQDKND